MLEFAIVAPLLLLLLFGIVEFGLAWRSYLTVSNSTRAGARVASDMGNDPLADWNALQAVRTGLRKAPANALQRVIIFDASSSGVPTAECRAGTPRAGVCNVYAPADLNRPSTAFGTCGGTSLDGPWCPASREVRQSMGADYVGVWIEYRHSYISSWLPGGGITIDDGTVMRLEPIGGTV
jgi:Flp pilus assembly protein TadG